MDKEHYLIDKLSSKYIGDDAAVVGDTLYSMDAFFEDIHFKREWMTLAQIGRKAILVNISDVIAMNAKAKFALVTVSLPDNLTLEDIDELTFSMEKSAKEYGCEIIGGDTIGADKLHISITIISQSNNPLLRKGLDEGNLLAFTGMLGESKRDLEKLIMGEEISKNSRFYEPKLRAEFIYKVREFLKVGMDISDGLYCDTNKLLDINSCGFEILKDISHGEGFSGEEYEMLIGFSKENIEEVKRVAKNLNVPLTIFAKVANNEKRFPCKSHHFI
jgi:thiamine-monophosphate kinase